MIRLPDLACAVAALVLPALPAAAQTVPPSKIACRVLLPEAEIPDNHGHSILILEVTVAPSHSGHRHQHDSVEYLHVLRGSGTLSIDGMADTALTPGKIVTIPPKTPHKAVNGGTADPLVFSATFIEPEHAHAVTTYVGEPDNEHGCPHQRPGK